MSLSKISKKDINFDIYGNLDPFCRINILYKKHHIGYCNLVREGNVACLADIFIYCHRRPMFNFIPFLKFGVNYRKNGFGTLLLNKAIEVCLEVKVLKIIGRAQGQLEILIPWYRTHKFNIDCDNNLLLDLSSLYEEK